MYVKLVLSYPSFEMSLELGCGDRYESCEASALKGRVAVKMEAVDRALLGECMYVEWLGAPTIGEAG